MRLSKSQPANTLVTPAPKTTASDQRPVNSPRQVLFASLVGTTIEFFDFYIYATAAVLVFPRLFFPASDPATATLASRDVWYRISGTADRIGTLRTLR